jgi:hypothetical protein
VNFPEIDEIVIGDRPVKAVGTHAVYELISNFEDMTAKINGMRYGPYKHVSLDGRDCFIFDIAADRIVGGPLGPYQVV